MKLLDVETEYLNNSTKNRQYNDTTDDEDNLSSAVHDRVQNSNVINNTVWEDPNEVDISVKRKSENLQQSRKLKRLHTDDAGEKVTTGTSQNNTSTVIDKQTQPLLNSHLNSRWLFRAGRLLSHKSAPIRVRMEPH